MKKELLFLILFFSVFSTMVGQQTAAEREYEIRVSGYVGSGGRNCRSHGLQHISLIFNNREPVHIFRSPELTAQQTSEPYFGNSKATFSGEIAEFSEEDELIGIQFMSHTRQSTTGGCAGSFDEDPGYINLIGEDFDSFEKVYGAEFAFPRHTDGGDRTPEVRVVIAPLAQIWYADAGDGNGCSDGSVGINATPGYKSSVYNWEFFDVNNMSPRNTPQYQAFFDEIAELGDEKDECEASCEDDEDPVGTAMCNEGCADEEEKAIAEVHVRRLQFIADGGQTTEFFVDPQWVPIKVDKSGQSSIDLRLSDLYPNEEERLTMIGNTIPIRLNPNFCINCGLSFSHRDLGISDPITVRFLPAPPSISAEPEIEQPSCSDTNDATLTIPFSRALTDNEELNIGLQRLTEGLGITPLNNTDSQDGKTDQEFLNEVNATYSIVVGSNIVSDGDIDISNNSYTWDGALEVGHYAIVINGSQTNVSGAPLVTCETFYYFFEITPPPPVEFDVRISRPACPNDDGTIIFDGQVRISSAEGGTGDDYQYEIDNSGDWVAFTGSRTIFLETGIHDIRVRDGNECESDPQGVEIITLDRIIYDSEIIDPDVPGGTGSITITNVIPGQPLAHLNDNDDPYSYELVTEDESGEEEVLRDRLDFDEVLTSLTFDNLEAGEYRLSYRSSGLCATGYSFTITDPAPLAFDLEKDPNSVVNCHDDTSAINVINPEGGKAPYSFDWYNGTFDNDNIPTSPPAFGGLSNNLLAGDYTVVMTDDNDITFTQNITVTAPAEIVIQNNIAHTAIECHNGTSQVTLTVNGRPLGQLEFAVWEGPATVWQNSPIFNLQANTSPGYLFRAREVGGTGCISDISNRLEISEPSEIQVSEITTAHANNVVFGGAAGEISLNIDGGTEGYTVTWTFQEDTEDTPIDIEKTGALITGLVSGIYKARIEDANECPAFSESITITDPGELLVSIAIADTDGSTTDGIACFGEKITLTAIPEGGSGTYTYQWFEGDDAIVDEESATLENVGAGVYKVYINDGNVTEESLEIPITEPAKLELSVSKTDVTCFDGNDGTIILDPSGGTRPYSFSIDGGDTYISEEDLTDLTISALTSGDYSILMRDDNACNIEAAVPINIGTPTEIEITPTIEHVTIADGVNGSISIEVNGGSGGYTYNWRKIDDPSFEETTQNIDELSKGSYEVTVTDNNNPNCKTVEPFDVLEPDELVVSIVIKSPILCYDDAFGELEAVVIGGVPVADATPEDYEYQWFLVEGDEETPLNTDLTLHMLTDLPAGAYKVIATDIEGATNENTIVFSQPDELIVTIDEENPAVHVTCFGASTGTIDVTVTGGPKDDEGNYLPYSYSWTKLEDPDFSSDTEDLVDITAGTYELVVIDDNTCTTSLSESVVITEPDAALEIYDIEVKDITGFGKEDGSITLEVRGGVAPYTYAWTATDTEDEYTSEDQDINELEAGIYELIVTDANDCTVELSREVIEPDALEVEIIELTPEESIKCFGDEVTLLQTTTKGGIVGDGYSYEWYNVEDLDEVISEELELTSVKAGEYVVIVIDANDNRAEDTYTVSEPEELRISNINVTHLECNGDENGVIDITVEGGVGEYIYRWNNEAGDITQDISSLRAGTYTVEIIDENECVLIQDIEVEQPGNLFVIDGIVSRTFPSTNGANDGSISLDIGGGTAPYSFEWRDSDGNLEGSTTNVLENIGTGKYSLRITDDNNCFLDIPDVDIFEPPVLEVHINPGNVISCFDDENGSITSTASGGAPFNAAKQYIYQWFNSDTGLPIGEDDFSLRNIGVGNYFVMITDAVGRNASSPVFTLVQPDELMVNLNSDFVLCGDGNDWTVTAIVTGGTKDNSGAYSYLWNTGDTGSQLAGVPAGSYSVEIIDARGCRTNDQIEIEIPEALSIDETLRIPNCFGGCDGRIDIVIKEGTGTAPFTYAWDTSDSTAPFLDGLCSGTYTVTVTDVKGCILTKEIELNDPEILTIDLGEDITLCRDQIATLDATISDPGATYAWSSENGFNSDQARIEVSETGIYEVLVTDGKGCTVGGEVFVETTDQVIDANFLASTQVFVGEEFVVVNNSEPIAESINWIFPEGAIVTLEEDQYAELLFEEPGEYEITMQSFRGLCDASVTKKVLVIERGLEETDVDGGDSEAKSRLEYTVYPNPSPDGKFKVDVALSNTQTINLRIFNLGDNRVLDARSGTSSDVYSFDYNMEGLPSGVYFIVLETPTLSQVRKLVIE